MQGVAHPSHSTCTLPTPATTCYVRLYIAYVWLFPVPGFHVCPCTYTGFTEIVWPTAILQPNGTTYNSVTTFYVVANVGVILFMFLLGCELDQRLLSRQWKKSAPIALSAIAFPFGVGCAASLWLEVRPLV